MNDMKSIRFPPLVADEMIRAILEGRKTVTRRIVPERTLDKYYDYDEWCNAVMPHDIPCTRCYEKDFLMEKPPYRPGDILYVRETWHQDLAVVRNSYHYECGRIVWDGNKFEVLVYGDGNNEDFIDKFAVNIYQEQ